MKRHSDHRAWLAGLKARKATRRALEAKQREQEQEQAKANRVSKPGDARLLLTIIAAIGGNR